MKTKNVLLITLSIIILFVVGIWWLGARTASASSSPLEATGVIEAREVSVAPEFGGKIVEVFLEEGQRVATGQPLLKLEDSLLQTQKEQAEAALQASQANLDLLKAGARSEQIQAAKAQLEQVEANLKLAEDSLAGATIGSQPEQVSALRANLERARRHYREIQAVLTSDQIEAMRSALTMAQGNASAAQVRLEELGKDPSNPSFVIASAKASSADALTSLEAATKAYDTAKDESEPFYEQLEAARLSLEVAQSNLAIAEARKKDLEAETRTTADGLQVAKKSYEEAQEQVDSSRNAYDALTSGVDSQHLDTAWEEVTRGQAALEATANQENLTGALLSVEALLDQVEAARAARDQAAANLAMLENGARQEEISLAQAQVSAALAQVEALDIQLDKTTLYAPWEGFILTRSAEPGQVVAPGSSLLQIANLQNLELTVYVREDQLGAVQPGQEVSVRVDAFPNKVFAGNVLRLANEAEFTPTNVQTKDDRTRLVFAVKIQLENPDLALKPGMIADVEFKP